ncbi:cation:proton antiporter family protein [Paenibacillus thermotolerans]|uniref:cation:proton antiporter family protein n=1 Tax=Paenibacillus thermotolerans TaxID=3027807 RepID=UPI00236872B6|nr:MULTISPECIES: cation:proton antiporter family protein [unclassified Paenibacillus]
MQHDLTSLMIVVAVAFLVPILLHQLRLKLIPVVVAEIVAGLLLGKTGFNVVHEDTWLTLLSLFGFIFLMFLSGLEIDFSMPQRSANAGGKGRSPLVLSIVLFAFILILSLGLSYALSLVGLVDDPYFMTLIVSTISLGVVVPVLKERKLMGTELGQTIFLTTVISDFVTMILLAVYVSLIAKDISKLMLLLFFFVIVFAIYRFIVRFFRIGRMGLFTAGTSQLGTRAVFALILLFVVLSESLGVEHILGAFLAGVIVSILSPRREFVHQLESFGYGFLIPIFFVMVGVRLDLRTVVSDTQVLLLIPVLLAAVFLSKIIPALMLKRWYSWREVAGTGILLSSTLSLVIAAATIAYNLGIIDQSVQGALILVAVISCLIFPVIFNRLVPKPERKPLRVSVVGANHITIPLSHQMNKDGYAVRLFSAGTTGAAEATESAGAAGLIPVADLSPRTLTEHQAFDTDLIVIGTMEDSRNMELADEAREAGVPRVIVRIEDPGKLTEFRNRLGTDEEERTTVFSTLYAARTLLKALIEQPSAVRLISEDDGTIREVRLNNPSYEESLLRELPLTGDILILRIYRGDSFIIPHGNTPVHTGDRLLVSGGAEHIAALRNELE